MLKLIKPNIKYQSSYLSYIEELGDEERYPFPLDFDEQDFSAMLERIEQFEQGINLPAGYVPSSTYWLIHNDEIIGVSNLRHHLNVELLKAGGHIGLSIRPSCRGGKFSVQLLQMTFAEAVAKGINQIHVHCYADNVASAKMIQAGGGVLQSEELIAEGQSVQRYVIECF
jgi:predicted acetyltransferase